MSPYATSAGQLGPLNALSDYLYWATVVCGQFAMHGLCLAWLQLPCDRTNMIREVQYLVFLTFACGV